MKQILSFLVILVGTVCYLTSCGGNLDSDYPYDDVDILYGNNGLGVPVPSGSYNNTYYPAPNVTVIPSRTVISTTGNYVPMNPGPVRINTRPVDVRPNSYPVQPGMGPGPVIINKTMPAWRELHDGVPSAAGRFRRN